MLIQILQRVIADSDGFWQGVSPVAVCVTVNLKKLLTGHILFFPRQFHQVDVRDY